ncbi:MAG: caspase family protein [Bacteroidota bacterium]
MHPKLLWVLLILIFASDAFSQDPPRISIDPLGHSEPVNELLFTPDGAKLISVSQDKTVRIWDTESGDLIRTIRTSSQTGSLGRLYCAALTPDGKYLALGGYFPKNEIRVIDLKRLERVYHLQGHTNVVTSLEFSSDGLKLASASADKTVRIWEMNYAPGFVEGNTTMELKAHEAQVYDLSFSPDDSKLVSASYDGSLRLWDLKNDTNESIRMYMHSDKVISVDFSPGGNWIASGGTQGKIILWDGQGVFKGQIKIGEKPVTQVRFVNDEVLLASASETKLYALSSKSPIKIVEDHENTVTAMAIYDNSILASCSSQEGDIYLRDIKSGEILRSMSGKGLTPKSLGLNKEKLAIGFKRGNQNWSKAFNVEELSYLWGNFDQKAFEGNRVSDGAYKLSKFDEYTLSTGFSGSVKNDPSTDGRIKSFQIINENKIAIGSDFSLKIYSRDGLLDKQLKSYGGEVFDIVSSEDGKYLYTACGDQTVRIWNIESGENVLTIFISEDDQWIVWTPIGYYMASAGGERYLGWHINRLPTRLAEFRPSYVYRKKFLRPDILKKSFELGSVKKAIEYLPQEKEEKLESTEPVEIVKSAPELKWVSPEFVEVNTNKNTYKIQLEVTSDTPIESVKILINGRPSGQRGFSRGTQDEYKKTIEQEIPLLSKRNEIRVFVSSGGAKMTSEPRIIESEGYQGLGNAKGFELINYKFKPDLYLLSVGISEFKNPDYNLTYADDDAIAITKAFTEKGQEIYEEVISAQFVNEEATKAKIIESFNWLKENVSEKDVVIIFLASHGINENGEFFILPHDGSFNDIESTLVSWSELADVLGGLHSKVLMLIDACHSGQLGTNVDQAKNFDNTEAVRNMTSDENGVIIMSASTGDETAQEHPDWGHGAFTLSLLEGLLEGHADIKKDQIVFLRELDFFVSERTNELTNGLQHPTTQKPSTISRMPVFKVDQ